MPELYETLTPAQRKFLRCLEASGSITKAARWARIHKQNHWLWMHQEGSGYPAAYEAARERGIHQLEDEAVRRAYDGIRKAVRYKGKIVGYDTEYDSTLLLACLRARHPKFQPQSTQPPAGAGGKDFTFETVRRALMEVTDADGNDLP